MQGSRDEKSTAPWGNTSSPHAELEAGEPEAVRRLRQQAFRKGLQLAVRTACEEMSQ